MADEVSIIEKLSGALALVGTSFAGYVGLVGKHQRKRLAAQDEKLKAQEQRIEGQDEKIEEHGRELQRFVEKLRDEATEGHTQLRAEMTAGFGGVHKRLDGILMEMMKNKRGG